jgi:hypothetical protein
MRRVMFITSRASPVVRAADQLMLAIAKACLSRTLKLDSRVILVETHDLAQRLHCLSPVLQFVLFTGQAVPDHGVFRLLGEHCGEGFDFRLDHRFVLNRLDSTDPLKLFFGMLRPLRATARDH